MCPGTLICWCCKAITEEIEISFAQNGINFTFEPSLDVSCISNGDHFVFPARILKRVHFEQTHLDRILFVVVQD